MDGFSVIPNLCPEGITVTARGDTLVFRAGPSLWSMVSGVLNGRAESQIAPSIVQAVVVDVVNEHAGWDIDNESVHENLPAEAAAVYAP